MFYLRFILQLSPVGNIPFAGNNAISKLKTTEVLSHKGRYKRTFYFMIINLIRRIYILFYLYTTINNLTINSMTLNLYKWYNIVNNFFSSFQIYAIY